MSQEIQKNNSYTADDIDVLEGLEAVRKRPGMYIGGVHKAGLHHMIWEIVDNAVDEVMNGHADRIKIKLHKDRETLSVNDNGRGIPVGMHSKYKRSALEIILTTLHSGGKFKKGNYKHSGGLHGVGLSVVNALSSHLTAEIKRDGGRFIQHYEQGKPVSELEKVEGSVRGSGSTITFRCDPEIFHGKVKFDPLLIKDRLEIKAFLHRGCRIDFIDETLGEKHQFYHEGGIEDYLQKVMDERNKKPAHPTLFSLQLEEPRLETVFCWTNGTDEQLLSFVNGIPTRDGGTHVNGIRAAVNKTIKAYATTHKLIPKGVTIAAEDIREGWVGILSTYVLEPQFQGQTKDRLNNPEIQSVVDQAVRGPLEEWLQKNPSIAKLIVERVIMAAKARQASRAASQLVRRQSPTRRLNLPGKLADCSSQDPTQCELFIVEGDSAGGSAKMGRNRKNQAILPLRGKVLNTETASMKKILENKELRDIIQALGCGIGKDFANEKLRYDKIILLMDADADGHHISTLLLTFFFRHMPHLITGGHIYIAQPPLYKIQIGKNKVFWALSDEEKESILADAPSNAKPDIQRFKGLGEMMPKSLYETTLDPKRRTLLKVHVEDLELTSHTFEQLLGKDASSRYQFIMDRAHEVQELDSL